MTGIAMEVQGIILGVDKESALESNSTGKRTPSTMVKMYRKSKYFALSNLRLRMEINSLAA
jgi:hypothetical protein